MIRQRRRQHIMAIWLGLFAMLMIHVGPLMSGAQALSVSDAVSLDRVVASAMHHHTHDHAAMLDPATAQPAVTASLEQQHMESAVDYHALMGHHRAPVGAPQWLANLEMCGYCDLLTVSPPLVFVLLLALPVLPPVQWLAVLPAPPKPLAAAHSLRHPRAPPFQLFT